MSDTKLFSVDQMCTAEEQQFKVGLMTGVACTIGFEVIGYLVYFWVTHQ